jgi:HK97 family phage prohead protease
MLITNTLKTKILEWTKLYNVEQDQVTPFQEEIGFKQCADCEDTRDGIKISGMLSTFKNIDREGDIVMAGAFDSSIKELKRAGKLPMLKDHDASTDSQIGSFTRFKATEEGLFVEGFISRTKQTEHIIKLIEDGHLNTLSMGGLFKFANGGQRDKRNRRFIEEVALFEGSVVVVPANPKATFTQKSSTPEQPANAEPVAQAKAQPVASHREKMIDALKILKSREGKKCL